MIQTFLYIAAGAFTFHRILQKVTEGKYSSKVRTIVIDFEWGKDDYKKPLKNRFIENWMKNFREHEDLRGRTLQPDMTFVRVEMQEFRRRFYGIFGKRKWVSAKNGLITCDYPFVETVLQEWKKSDSEMQVLQFSPSFDLWKRRKTHEKFGF
jgi:hypothetical protein